MLLVSILCSFEKVLTSELKIDFFADYSYSEFPNRNTFKTIFAKENHSKSVPGFIAQHENPIYFALFLIKFIVNDILIVTILCIIDSMMIIKYRKDILTRKRLLSSFQNMERIVKPDRHLMRTITTILLNTSILIISRSFEFLFNFLIFYFFVFNPICSRLNKICTNFYHIGNIFFFISSWFSFVVYYCINKEFRKGLNLYIKYLKFKIK